MVVFKTTTIIIGLISNLLSYLSLEFELQPLYLGENKNTNNNNETTTNRNIVVSNGTWSSTVKSIFIYGAAVVIQHLNLTRAPGFGLFKLGRALGAFAVDTGGKFIENAINDPNYIRDPVNNWKTLWSKNNVGVDSNEEVKIEVSSDTNLINEVQNEINKIADLNNVATFLPSSSTLSGENSSEVSSFINELVLPIIQTLKPQQVDYSIDLLMDQHQFIAICLFIMTISALFLFLVFLYNILLFFYKDKILNYFTNKYIVLYLKIQFKILNIEIIVLALLIIYYFYFLILGLHFLAVFPINVNI